MKKNTKLNISSKQTQMVYRQEKNYCSFQPKWKKVKN